MQVIKFDIKKELIDVEESRRYFKIYDPGELPSFVLSESEEPYVSRMDVNVKTYAIKEFRFPHEKKSRYYLINIEESGLWKEFLNITECEWQRILEESRREISKICHQDLTREIKRLPWWKRLFNKF